MAAPPTLPIVVPKRVPFDDTIVFIGADYSDATFAMHVREEEGDTGTPIITLGDVSGSEGISATFDDEYTDPETEEPVEATIFRIRILEATLEALPLGADTSEDVELVYDLHVTPAGGVKFILCEGPFLVTPGSTI